MKCGADTEMKERNMAKPPNRNMAEATMFLVKICLVLYIEIDCNIEISWH